MSRKLRTKESSTPCNNCVHCSSDGCMILIDRAYLRGGYIITAPFKEETAKACKDFKSK